jgi:hypothetical protein
MADQHEIAAGRRQRAQTRVSLWDNTIFLCADFPA